MITEMHKDWLNIAKRLQSVGNSCKGDGCSILTIRVLVDGEAKPILWSEPRRVRLDPKHIDTNTVLSLLTGDDG